jgi:hypothetical protein
MDKHAKIHVARHRIPPAPLPPFASGRVAAQQRGTRRRTPYG